METPAPLLSDKLPDLTAPGGWLAIIFEGKGEVLLALTSGISAGVALCVWIGPYLSEVPMLPQPLAFIPLVLAAVTFVLSRRSALKMGPAG